VGQSVFWDYFAPLVDGFLQLDVQWCEKNAGNFLYFVEGGVVNVEQSVNIVEGQEGPR
jgi:hypothetical protein